MVKSQKDMLTEADTCRLFITPKLQAAGWDSSPHEIAEQRSFTAGRIVLAGRSAKRREGKRADYLLRYTRDFTIAVVEAKSESKAGSRLCLPGDRRRWRYRARAFIAVPGCGNYRQSYRPRKTPLQKSAGNCRGEAKI